jgi:hypothetical protein
MLVDYEIVDLASKLKCLVTEESHSSEFLDLVTRSRDLGRANEVFRQWIHEIRSLPSDGVFDNTVHKPKGWLASHRPVGVADASAIVLSKEILRSSGPKDHFDYASARKVGVIKLELVQTFTSPGTGKTDLSPMKLDTDANTQEDIEPLVGWAQWTCFVSSKPATVLVQERLLNLLRASPDYRFERLRRAAQGCGADLPLDALDDETAVTRDSSHSQLVSPHDTKTNSSVTISQPTVWWKPEVSESFDSTWGQISIDPPDALDASGRTGNSNAQNSVDRRLASCWTSWASLGKSRKQ